MFVKDLQLSIREVSHVVLCPATVGECDMIVDFMVTRQNCEVVRKCYLLLVFFAQE